MFVPSKPAERRALAVDKRAYDASRLASVPADAFDPEASLAPAKGASAKPRAEEGTLSHELAQLELAMDSDLEEEEDWVLNDDFVANALQLGVSERDAEAVGGGRRGSGIRSLLLRALWGI